MSKRLGLDALMKLEFESPSFTLDLIWFDRAVCEEHWYILPLQPKPKSLEVWFGWN